VGVSDIAHELKLLFFNGFAALTPILSRYASNACPTGTGTARAAREKVYRRFYLLPFAQENGFFQAPNGF
jgi:hypothetical protein